MLDKIPNPDKPEPKFCQNAQDFVAKSLKRVCFLSACCGVFDYRVRNHTRASDKYSLISDLCQAFSEDYEKVIQIRVIQIYISLYKRPHF